jgi:hypothetical protein
MSKLQTCITLTLCIHTSQLALLFHIPYSLMLTTYSCLPHLQEKAHILSLLSDMNPKQLDTMFKHIAIHVINFHLI